MRAIVAALLLVACSTAPKPATVTGQWVGRVASQNPVFCDTLGWTLQQADTAIGGSWSLSQCGVIVGVSDVGGLAGSIVADSVTIYFNGSIFFGHLTSNGDTLAGTVTGGSLNGVGSVFLDRK